MNFELMEALRVIEREKGIHFEILLEALANALPCVPRLPAAVLQHDQRPVRIAPCIAGQAVRPDKKRSPPAFFLNTQKSDARKQIAAASVDAAQRRHDISRTLDRGHCSGARYERAAKHRSRHRAF